MEDNRFNGYRSLRIEFFFRLNSLSEEIQYHFTNLKKTFQFWFKLFKVIK